MFCDARLRQSVDVVLHVLFLRNVVVSIALESVFPVSAPVVLFKAWKSKHTTF